MATKTVLETLEAARKLIADRKHWTTGEYARDAKSRRIRWDSEKACRFCVTGAMSRVSGTFSGATSETGEAFIRVVGMYPHVFNDSHTHKQVLAALDAVIAKEREAQHVL